MMSANLQMTDYDVDGRPGDDDVAVVSAELSEVLTQELDGASVALGVTAADILLAALGRAIERTMGEGVAAVDVPGHGRTMHPVKLSCVGPQLTDATEMLACVHHMMAAVSLRLTVHGVPDDPHAQPLSDIHFAYGTSEPARLGHLIELCAYRRGEVVALDWWYDGRSFERYTIQELSEQLPYALIELTSEATAPALAGAELAMAH
ncbi:MAG: hypothetical protein QOF25_5195 [Mycobacterium sp.]|jgi:hypothetical protein|nr:hypothetical protein [Mycobacterium sp.]